MSKKKSTPAETAGPPPTATHMIQRRIAAIERPTELNTAGEEVSAWIDAAEYSSKAAADRALAALATGGVFRIARVYPAVELTVEKRDVVTNRKPV